MAHIVLISPEEARDHSSSLSSILLPATIISLIITSIIAVNHNQTFTFTKSAHTTIYHFRLIVNANHIQIYLC